MRVRNYEKKELIVFLIIISFIIEFIFFISLIIIKEDKYLKISSVVVKDNIVLIMVNKKERKVLYDNKVLFCNDKKIKYKILEDRGVVLKKKYYEILIEFKFPKKKKTNDLLELVIKKERIRLIEIFKTIMEGG